MKKFTLCLFAVLLSIGYGYSQANISFVAPPNNGGSTQLRAPNGNASQTGMRGCFIVQPAELSGLTLSTISSFGFSLALGTSVTAVPGTFTVYLQNTAVSTYTKGTNWTTAIAGMTQVYNGPMTIPPSNVPVNINLTLPTPFPYSGGGLFVAYDWSSSGPFDSDAATYYANNALTTGNMGGATIDSPTLPTPTTLANTNFRPCFIFGGPNTATNQVTVLNVSAPGEVAYPLNTPHVITSLIKNSSSVTLNGINVSLNVSGANTFASNVVISSLAAGASTNISFAPFNPQTLGLNTISVSVPADNNNLDNSATWSQSVTCNFAGINPPVGTYTDGIGFSNYAGIVAYKVVPPINTNLAGVRIAISNDVASVGKPVYGVMANSAGAIVATSNTITITAAMAGTFQNFTFPSLQSVTAGGTYYVGLGLPLGSAGYFPVGSQPVSAPPTGAYYSLPLIGGAPSLQSANLGYLGIEPVYGVAGLNLNVSQSTPSTCAGQPVTITASGMNTYTWLNPASSTNPLVLSPTVTTVYNVIGTDAGTGCTNQASITHSVSNPIISGSTNKSTICAGQSATLSASTGAASYTWSTGLPTRTIIVSPAATTVYTVGGTWVDGCPTNIVSITQTVSECTGIMVNSGANNEVKVFPNPLVNGKSNISGLNGANTITIYNIIGQAVLTQQTEEENVTIDLGTAASGTYIIKITGSVNKTVKIVNQN